MDIILIYLMKNVLVIKMIVQMVWIDIICVVIFMMVKKSFLKQDIQIIHGTKIFFDYRKYRKYMFAFLKYFFSKGF